VASQLPQAMWSFGHSVRSRRQNPGVSAGVRQNSDAVDQNL
jgi:hypothetical protein